MKLWIGNVSPDASDDEVRALVRKYTAVDCAKLRRFEGDGSRPVVIVESYNAEAVLMQATNRLNGMFWKGRRLSVQMLTNT